MFQVFLEQRVMGGNDWNTVTAGRETARIVGNKQCLHMNQIAALFYGGFNRVVSIIR